MTCATTMIASNKYNLNMSRARSNHFLRMKNRGFSFTDSPKHEMDPIRYENADLKRKMKLLSMYMVLAALTSLVLYVIAVSA